MNLFGIIVAAAQERSWFWEKPLKVFVPKGTCTGPILKFLKFYHELMDGTFMIFCMILQQHKDVNNQNDFFFGKTFIWNVWAKIGPKWAQNEVFLVLWKFNAMKVSDFLHEVTTA